MDSNTSRIIKVERCSECPFAIRGGEPDGLCLKIGKYLKGAKRPPRWCPLPKESKQ